jgi:type II secretory pathway component PulJ
VKVEQQSGASASPEAGYTLIDMIVGLALLSMVVALLPPLLKLAQRTLSAQAELVEHTSVAAALHLLEGRLREAWSISEQAEDGRLGLAFRGDGDSLTFVAPRPVGPEGGGLARYRFVLQLDGAQNGHVRLVLQHAAYKSGTQPDEATWRSHPLANLAGAPRFAYFGALEGEQVRRWHSRWPVTDRLPNLIALTTDAATPGSRQNVLTVAPRLGTGRDLRQLSD